MRRANEVFVYYPASTGAPLSYRTNRESTRCIRSGCKLQDVRFAAGARFCKVIENLELPSYAAGIDWIGEEMAEAFPERDSLPLEKHRAFDVGEVFARRTPPLMIDDILQHSEDWKPDLIVRDLWNLVGALQGFQGAKIQH